LDSRRVKISLVAILIAGAVLVYHAYTIASTTNTLKALKTVTSWTPLNDVIKEIVDTIVNYPRL